MSNSTQDLELLALLMEEQGIEHASAGAAKPAVRSDPAQRPLSFSQERLWMLDQLHPGEAVYNVPVAMRLRGMLDVAALREAVRMVLERHEVLRTAIQNENGTARQTLEPAPSDPLEWIDLTSHDPAEREQLLMQAAQEEVLRPFDLARPPLLRALCIRVSSDDHAVVLVMHHIASDAWSVNLLLAELSASYSAIMHGTTPRLAAPPLQFADYAAWQRADAADGGAFAPDLDYWQRKLTGGNVPNIELPTDHPRPATETFAGGVERDLLDEDVARKIRQAAADAGVTPFIFLQAAFVLLLHRYTNQTDLIVGTPVSGRAYAEIEPLIGFFLNTLVLRNQFEPGWSFKKLLNEVRTTTLEAFEHQAVPFERLVKQLQPQRDLSRSVLFQVMFTMNDSVDERSVRFGDLELSPLNVYTHSSKFDLTLSVVDDRRALRLALEYNRELFDPETAQRMLGAYRWVLGQVLEDPGKALEDYDLLDDAQRLQIESFNQTARVYDLSKPLHRLIVGPADGWGQRIAVSDAGGRSLTYQELMRRAQALAWRLVQSGISRGEAVGVCLERCVELEIAVLGTMLAGAAYMPLDPNYPPQRINSIIEDAGLRHVLCHTPTLDRLGAALCPEDARINLDFMVDLPAPPVGALEALEPGPHDLGYVIYTSGTTGTPKGAMNEHGAFFNRLVWLQENAPLAKDDVVLQKAPIGFDVSVCDFFWPLIAGARLHMARPGGHRDAEYIVSEILSQRITTLHFVPSMLGAFLSVPGVEQCAAVLRKVMVGGEALAYELKERFFRLLPGVELHNQYGPSEAAVDVTHHRCAPAHGIDTVRAAPRPRDGSISTLEISEPLHELIAGRRWQWPDAAAVSADSNAPLTHAELHAQADALASHLLSLRIAPGSLVGVCVQRSLELEVALLAILKSGYAYVPLDPSYPAARLAMMLKDAKIHCLVCHDATSQICGSLEIEDLSVVRADRPEMWTTQQLPLPRVSPGDLAYMIYTSGSTGTPKGAMNEHRGIVNRLLWMQEEFHLTPDDVVLQKTPSSFDVSVWEFFWPLLAGARLHMARPGGHQDPEYLAEVIQQQRVTTLHFVPSMLSAFLQCADASKCNQSLRRVICSGEALGYELKERFFKILPDVELHNLYGPTEAAVDVTHHICRPAREARGARKTVPIGRPIANTQIRILDPKRRPLPIGVPGELHIGGVQVGRGYFNRPELTQAKFIPDPFDHTGKGRLYKTGDLARWLPNGEIEFLGRLDFQVKIRGQRIELGEVESALMSLPNVKDAAAAARGKNGEDQRLVGYLVLSDGAAKLGVEEIRSHLSSRLPDGMIPSQFVFMDKLPLSANGKLDRKMLPDAALVDRSTLKQAYTAPTTSVQRKLAEIWQQVLKLPQIGIHDNFFALGGDSILSLQIIARANTAGLKLAARDIFQRQTIAQLAEAVVEATPVNIEQGPVVGSAPLLPIQHWLLSQDQPRLDHFNQAIMLLPACPLDHQRLGAAFEQLLRHHDALRLRVTRSATGWSQEILPPDVAREAILSVVDLSNVADPLLSLAIERHATEAQESLSLNQGHVIRAVHLQLRHSQRLLIVIHHMAVDGMSWRVLLEDLQTAYEQLERGQPVQLPPKTASVRDWARTLHEHSRSSEISKQVDDWQKLIAGTPAPMPVDAPTAANMNTAADAQELAVSLDEETTRRLLRDAFEAYKTQINDLLLTALAMAYREWTGSSEILIDLEGHGREALDGVSIDVGRTVGWFTSLYPVRLSLPSGSDIGDSVIAIKEQIRKVPANGLSYGVLRYFGDDATRQRLAGLPRPQICFNYLGQMDGAFDAKALFSLSDDPIGPSRSTLTRRPWLIELNAAVTADRFRLQVAYNASLHRRSTIERFAQSFLDALRRIIDRCTSQVATRHTPSDFALAGLDQDDLDQLAGLLGGDA